MKTKPGRFRTEVLQCAGWILAIAGLLACPRLRADGCFVVPKFVWDKHKDINEPTQKAIIAYDAGYESLILQVKYDGPVEEFGWLIPVPNLPKVKQASMECFYELSKYTQKKFDETGTMMMSLSASSARAEEPEPPVKVIAIKTVGAYQVAVLSTKDAGALESWLNANNFALPPDNTGVIDSYVKQGWYFVAARINLSKAAGFAVLSGAPKAAQGAKAALEEKLSSGELHPLQISFASEKCVFPLKISSINGKPSEVQVYVLSPEPLVEKVAFEQKLSENYAWRTNAIARRKASTRRLRMFPGRYSGVTNAPPMPDQLMERSLVNDAEVLPYAEVSRKDLPVCSKELSLRQGQQQWLTKKTWTFQPEEMRDLEFVPAVPEFTAHLGEGEGAFAAADLAQLGTTGGSALLLAMKSPDAAVRAHATSALEPLSREELASQFQGWLEPLLPTLLKDSDPEVRFHAAWAMLNLGDSKYFATAMELLRDDYSEVSAAALTYLIRQRVEVPKHVAEFRRMLKDTNGAVQVAGLQVLFNNRVSIAREDLLALFSVPRMEAAGVAEHILEPQGISCAEAKPLLQNSFWMCRMLGLAVLARNTNSQSVEFALPLLRDSEPVIRDHACDLLWELTGQDFTADQPDKWESWWAKNKATFAPDQEKMAERARARREERMRQRRDAVRQNLDTPGPEGPP
jgi:hypothetical protein